MSACDEIQGLLMDYVLEDIPLRDAKRVERHLAECEACQREYSEIAGTGKALVAVRALAEIEGTAEFQQDTRRVARVEGRRVMEAVRAHRGEGARRTALRARRRAAAGSWLVALLALAVATVAGAILYVEKKRLDAEERLPEVQVAELTDARGTVELFLAEAAKHWTAIEPGRRLSSRDTVSVREGAARLRLGDGSALFMDAGSEIAFSASRDAFQSSLLLMRGRIYVEVTRNNRGFRVKTRAGDVRAWGRAAFGLSLSADERELEVIVTRGDAQILGRKGHVVVGATHAWTVTSERAPTGPRQVVDLAAVVGWRYALLSVAELRRLFAGRAQRLPGGHVRVRYDASDANQLRDWIDPVTGRPPAESWKVEEGAFLGKAPAALLSRARLSANLRLVVDLIPVDKVSVALGQSQNEYTIDILPATGRALAGGRRVRLELTRKGQDLMLTADGEELFRSRIKGQPAAAVGMRVKHGKVSIDRIVMEGTLDPAWLTAMFDE